MDSFWLKMAGIVIVIIIGVVFLANFLSSGIKEATDYERVGKMMEAQEAELQAELAEAELKAKQAKVKQPKIKRPVEQAKPRQPKIAEMSEEDEIQAERLYQMALMQYKLGKKPFLGFKKMVDYCRELFEKYPDSPQAAKAKVLMRKMPERYRKQYNVAKEEMGL